MSSGSRRRDGSDAIVLGDSAASGNDEEVVEDQHNEELDGDDDVLGRFLEQ
jgi:hypothetical protein